MKAYQSELFKRIVAAGKEREVMVALLTKTPLQFEGKEYTVKIVKRKH